MPVPLPHSVEYTSSTGPMPSTTMTASLPRFLKLSQTIFIPNMPLMPLKRFSFLMSNLSFFGAHPIWAI